MTEKLPVIKTYGKVLKLTVNELYQSMGYMFLVSLIRFIAALPMTFVLISISVYAAKNMFVPDEVKTIFPLFIFSMILMAVWNTLVAGPVNAALFGMGQVRKESYLEFGTFFDEFRRMYWSSFKVYGTYSFGLTLLVINFIITLMESNFLLKVIGLISFYVMIMVVLLSLYLSPLIYYKHRYKEVFRKAFLIMMDNFALTFLVNITAGLIFLLSVPSVILLLFVFGAFYIFMIDNAFDLIAKKYEPVEAKA